MEVREEGGFETHVGGGINRTDGALVGVGRGSEMKDWLKDEPSSWDTRCRNTRGSYIIQNPVQNENVELFAQKCLKISRC